MKIVLMILLLALLQICTGQKLISKWSFDNSTSTPDTGQGSLSTQGGVAFTSFVAGNPSSGKAYGTNTYPSQSQNNEKAGIHIKLSTQGLKNISLKFDQYRSNTASKKTVVMVSADGSNFIKVDSLVATTGSTWATKFVDLKSLTGLNNNAEIHILLLSSFVGSQYVAAGSSSTYSTSGTWRFDNVMVFGADTAMPLIKPKLTIGVDKTTLSEGSADTVNIIFTLSDSFKLDIKNKVNLAGFGIDSGDFTWLGTDSLKIPKGSVSDTLKLKITDDLLVESLETGTITIEDLDTNVTILNIVSISIQDNDIQSILISAVQGKADASTMVKSIVAVEGIVTADLQAANEQGGFYMQDVNPDGDPLSSDGIFVKNLNTFPVEEGDHVKVTGKVLEEFGQTILSEVSSIIILSKNNTVAPVNIVFPGDSVDFPERFEGMKVRVSQVLTVTENYHLGRYGEITVSVNGRLFNPSNLIDPNDDPKEGNQFSGISNLPAVSAQQSLNNRSKILICDKLSVQNPDPIPFLDTVNKTLRSGSTIDTLVGVLGYAYGFYRVYPSDGHPKINYAARPAVPFISGANLKIVGMNVLNYFNGDGDGGGFPTLRGAATLPEFVRQKAKIVAAIKTLDADVFGLMEMENDGDSDRSAINDLVTSINDAYGSNVYDYIRDPKDSDGNPGTDPIKVTMIYKSSVVIPLGTSKSHNDVSFALLGRPPLAQTFTLKSNGEKFTIIVNHLKSKACASAPSDPLDNDQLDGQGCFNATRKKQAMALMRFIDTLIQHTNDSDIIAIGDFNANDQEDPLDILRTAGLVSITGETYSYIFDGQAGSLDHGFVTPSMFNALTNAAKWHINCDEPVIIDYTLAFKTQDLYSPIPYRSSDHDPLIAGFNLVKKPSVVKTPDLHVALKIYPQPNHGSFTIDVGGLGTSSLSIYNLTGVLIYSEEIIDGIRELQTNLPAGLYYLVIEGQGGRVAHKLLIW